MGALRLFSTICSVLIASFIYLFAQLKVAFTIILLAIPIQVFYSYKLVLLQKAQKHLSYKILLTCVPMLQLSFLFLMKNLTELSEIYLSLSYLFAHTFVFIISLFLGTQKVPLFVFKEYELLRLYKYGFLHSKAKVANILSNNGTVFLGSLLGQMALLGNFTRINALTDKPVTAVGEGIDQVLFPKFSSSNTQVELIHRWLQIYLEIVVVCSFYISLVLNYLSAELVDMVWGRDGRK